MLGELFLAVILGCLAGLITGLTPGLHINLVSVIFLSVSPIILGYINIISAASFLIAMSITHTFTDFISSTYLGAPNDDTALAVLPAHKLLLDGMGYEAVRLTVIGSLLSLVAVIAMTPLLIIAVPFIFNSVKDYISWILIAVMVFMIFREDGLDKRFWTFFLIAVSGILGIIVLNMPNLKDPLLPMFSGLFGASVLFLAIWQKTILPEQRTTELIKLKAGNIFKSITGSVLSGSLVSIFPGLGPAQAAVISTQFWKKIDEYSYLILVGGINTVSMILSLITLFTIDKARNGSIVVVQNLVQKVDINILILFLSVSLIAGGIATFLTFFSSKVFSKLLTKVNYSLLSGLIILFVSFMVSYFSGIIGLLVFIVATFIGLIANIMNLNRSSAMAGLLVPIALMGLV